MNNQSWEEAHNAWDTRAHQAATTHPLKVLKSLPSMPGITEEASKNLKWNSLKWLIAKDKNRAILKGFLKHPFKYGLRYLISCLKSKPYTRDGDLFYYGINEKDFLNKLSSPETLLVLGFSYCHKPFECPSGRFSPDCINDPQNPTCQQCFIGKCTTLAPKKTLSLFIPTIHYIGEKMFHIAHTNPNKEIFFIITACEMTLEMFGDFGNMVGIKGVGVRLDGRICNTLKAFELSEEGIKPGLTVVLDPTKQRILSLLKAAQGP